MPAATPMPAAIMSTTGRARNLNEILMVRPAARTCRAGERALGHLSRGRRRQRSRLSDAAAGLRPAATCRPSILPHGGPASRDEWGFDWLAQYLAHQGYAVLQPNYRGSAGYGDQWLQQNGFRGWRTSIGDITAGARWLAAQGIADPNRMAILGWSYGGYAALQAGGDRAGPVQGDRRDRAGDRSPAGQGRRRATIRCSSNVAEYIGSGPHIARRLAAAQCRGDHGAGAAVPRRPRHQRRRHPFAADGRGAARRRQAKRAGHLPGPRARPRRQRRRGCRCCGGSAPSSPRSMPAR